MKQDNYSSVKNKPGNFSERNKISVTDNHQETIHEQLNYNEMPIISHKFINNNYLDIQIARILKMKEWKTTR